MQHNRHIKYCLLFITVLCHGCSSSVDDLFPTVDDLFDESYHHHALLDFLYSIKIYKGSVLQYQCSPTGGGSTYFGEGQWSRVHFSCDPEPSPPDVAFQRDQGLQPYVDYNSLLQLFQTAPTSSTIILNQGEQICEFPWSVGSFIFTAGCVDKQQQLTDWRVTLVTMEVHGFDRICDLGTLFRENMAGKLPPCPDGDYCWWEMRDEF